MVRVLRDGLNDIHRQFPDQLNDDWPLDVCLRRIEHFSSGLFAFSSTIIRFVGDANIRDPNGQLQICMNSLGGHGPPGPMHPSHVLGLLYRQIVSNVPDDARETMMRILGITIIDPAYKISRALWLAEFLCIETLFLSRIPTPPFCT